MKNRSISTAGSRHAFLLSAALLALLGAGCAAGSAKVYQKDGKTYGVTSGAFRDRWWNYYERGDSYLEGGYYQDAAEDFQKAINQRETDQRRSRTYGMHFTDYFAHRELGIAYLGMGRTEDAIKELESSLNAEESAKAKFYLNKARQALLSAGGQGLTGLSLSVAGPQHVLTNKFQYKVAGKAVSDGYVSGVRIAGKPQLVELASKEINFDRQVALKEGSNVIRVEASDLAGKTAQQSVEVDVDRRGPVLDLVSPWSSQLLAGGKVLVKGTAYDPSGITAVTVNGKAIAMKGGNEVEFTEEVTVAPGRSVELSATDAAGNATTAKVEPGLLEQGQGSVSWLPTVGGVMYCSLDSDVFIASAKTDGVTAPKISLKDLAEAQEVYFDSVYLEGSVSGVDDIASVTINGEPIISRKGKKLFFNYLLPLKDGENKVEIKAVDAQGHESRKTVVINRKPQKARALGTRMTVSALPFQDNDKSPQAGLLYDALINAMVEQKRFNLVERTMLEEVLHEQALSQEAIVDPSTAARLGKLVAAEGVLAGSLHETDKSVEIFIRMVDTETTEIIEATDVYGEDKSMKGLSELMEGLAVKLKNGYPLLEGLVLKKDGNDLVVDIGNQNGVKKNMYIVLFREGEHMIHPVTGKDLGAPTELLGRAKVVEVYDEMSKAELVKSGDKGEVKAMDMVITK